MTVDPTWEAVAGQLQALAAGQAYALDTPVETELATLQAALDALFPEAADGGFRLPEELIARLSGQPDPASVPVRVQALEVVAAERARVDLTWPTPPGAWQALFEGAPPAALAGWSADTVGLRLGLGLSYPLEAT